MPLKNEFFGVFKTLKVGDKYIIAESLSQSREMEVRQQNFIQGTAKNRIMDIGGVSETYSINAPILIGGGSKIDGRTLLNDQIENALKRTGATLPILQSASIDITAEGGGKVALTLLSDGAPTNGVFEIRDEDSEELTDGTTADLLNPLLNTPTRIAKFYDFRVSLGGYQLYVKEARISVNIQTVKEYFLAGKDGTTGNGNPVPTPSNPNNFGTQFAWLGVSGITVEGSGKAAVLLTDKNNDGDVVDSGESVNYGSGTSDITLQPPGVTNTVSTPFAIEIYTGTQWVSLFRKNGSNDDLFDLSKSVVKKRNFQASSGLLTVDFEFACYVK